MSESSPPKPDPKKPLAEEPGPIPKKDDAILNRVWDELIAREKAKQSPKK